MGEGDCFKMALDSLFLLSTLESPCAMNRALLPVAHLLFLHFTLHRFRSLPSSPPMEGVKSTFLETDCGNLG